MAEDREPEKAKPEGPNGVGMPAVLWLDEFAAKVWQAFPEHGPAYHVGSSLVSKTWRDVDIRLIIEDAAYEKEGFGDPRSWDRNAKWIATCMAWAALGRQMTGLPIDFQIQPRTLANDKFKPAEGCRRSAVGLAPMRV